MPVTCSPQKQVTMVNVLDSVLFFVFAAAILLASTSDKITFIPFLIISSVASARAFLVSKSLHFSSGYFVDSQYLLIRRTYLLILIFGFIWGIFLSVVPGILVVTPNFFIVQSLSVVNCMTILSICVSHSKNPFPFLGYLIGLTLTLVLQCSAIGTSVDLQFLREQIYSSQFLYTNALALFYSVTLLSSILTLFLQFRPFDSRPRPLGIIFSFTCIAAILYCAPVFLSLDSRRSFVLLITFFFSLLLTFLLLNRRKIFRKKVFNLKNLILSGIVLILFSIYTKFLFTGADNFAFSEISLNSYAEDVRPLFWQSYLENINLLDFLIGGGYGFSRFFFKNTINLETYSHNTVLELLLTFGCVGFVAYFLILSKIFLSIIPKFFHKANALRNIVLGPTPVAFLMLLTAAYVSVFILGLSQATFYDTQSATLIAIPFIFRRESN